MGQDGMLSKLIFYIVLHMKVQYIYTKYMLVGSTQGVLRSIMYGLQHNIE